MISICDESTDEVLATAKTPELAEIIKKAIEQEISGFSITEDEVVRLTGYSRVHLWNLREGRTRKIGNKEYTDDPVLEQGTDWQRFGRAVLYTTDSVGKLQTRRNQNEGQ